MKIFLDTADLRDVSLYVDFIDGVTTNPSIMSHYKSEEHKNIIHKICAMTSGHVSVEVESETFSDMLQEGKNLSAIHGNICVKLPCTYDGLRVCKALSSAGIATNLTLCFSAAQAILAAKCGATYVSPFVGRLEDVGHDGMSLVEEIIEIYDSNSFETEVLVASVRSLQHVIQAAMLGVGAITMPTKILQSCFMHPLTDVGLKIFAKDSKKNTPKTTKAETERKHK
jgi:transaldolase